MKQFGYPKTERLKSRKAIELLFTKGKSVGVYPLRMVFMAKTEGETKVGVSVSKKYFKKAVDRNYYKRVLRETYRQNKQLLHSNIQQPFDIMLFYQTKDTLSFEEINQKMISLVQKFYKNSIENNRL